MIFFNTLNHVLRFLENNRFELCIARVVADEIIGIIAGANNVSVMHRNSNIRFYHIRCFHSLLRLNARLRFRYANGVEVRLTFPDEEPRRGPQLGAVFAGEDCKIEINRNKFTTNPPDFIKHPPDPKLAEKWEGDGWVAKGHVQNWFDCIRSREKPNADVEIGHRTASLCQLLVITRQLGRPVKWDPDQEIFPGDEEANALLDRPRREGWELPQF